MVEASIAISNLADKATTRSESEASQTVLLTPILSLGNPLQKLVLFVKIILIKQ